MLEKQLHKTMDGLKGAVQRVETQQLRFIDEISHEKPFSQIFRFITEYDRDGKKQLEIAYNPDDSISSKEMFYYNAKGQLIEKTQSRISDTPEWRWNYEINEHENYRIERVYDENDSLIGKDILRFNPDGTKKEELSYDESETLIQSNFFQLQKNDHATTVESIVTSPKGLVLKKTVYTYNLNGQLIEKAVFNANSVRIEKEVYEYDELGNPIRETAYNPKDEITHTYLFTYEYDAHQNWIKKQISLVLQDDPQKDSHPSEELNRVISYYSP